MNPVTVCAARITHLPVGWDRTHCLICQQPIGIVYPGKPGLCVAPGEIWLGGAKRFHVEHMAHRRCVKNTHPLLRVSLQRRSAAHQLAELIAQLN